MEDILDIRNALMKLVRKAPAGGILGDVVVTPQMRNSFNITMRDGAMFHIVGTVKSLPRVKPSAAPSAAPFEALRELDEDKFLTLVKDVSDEMARRTDERLNRHRELVETSSDGGQTWQPEEDA